SDHARNQKRLHRGDLLKRLGVPSVRLSAREFNHLPPHFSVSSATSFPKSAGEPPMSEAPSSAKRAFALGSSRIALISLLSLSMITSGVPFGPPTPYHAFASWPGTKSATVGRSGSTWERAAVVTANGRNLPALINSSDVGTLSNITCTWPLIRSVSAGAPPRYGTCTMSMPVIILNSSPDTWMVEPAPEDAMLSLPGLAFA